MRLESHVPSRGVVTIALTLAIASPAHAQFGPDLHGTTVSASLDLPAGWLADSAGTGFGLALRQGGNSSGAAWSGRGGFAFDYFTGKGPVNDVQMLQFGFDIVHHSNEAFYQFGGFSLGTNRITRRGSGSTLITESDQNFGLTGGVGVNYGSGDVKWFLEFAASTYIRSRGNLSWMPVRIGLRF